MIQPISNIDIWLLRNTNLVRYFSPKLQPCTLHSHGHLSPTKGWHKNLTEIPYLYSVKKELVTPSPHLSLQPNFRLTSPSPTATYCCNEKLPLLVILPLPPWMINYGPRKLFWVNRKQGKSFPAIYSTDWCIFYTIYLSLQTQSSKPPPRSIFTM